MSLPSRIYERFDTILKTDEPIARAIKALQHRLHGIEAVIFGGVIRDLVLERSPRDIDVVFRGTTEQVSALLPYRQHRNNFGGLQIRNCEGIPADLWPLDETYAFTVMRPPPATPDFKDLPKTTFFNLEAIVIDLHNLRTIYEGGFYQALGDRVLEVNFEPNSAPVFQAMRAIVTAKRFGMTLGPKLRAYVERETARVRPQLLVSMQRMHYGEIIVPQEELSQWGIAT